MAAPWWRCLNKQINRSAGGRPKLQKIRSRQRGAEFSAHDIAHLFAPDRTNHSSEATPTTDTPTIHLLPADRRAFAISDDSRSGTLWAKPGEW